MNPQLNENVIHAIMNCTEAQLDLAFALLKYREIGILRKARGFAIIFGLNENELVKSLPTDNTGRILDKQSRYMFHDVLIERAKA